MSTKSRRKAVSNSDFMHFSSGLVVQLKTIGKLRTAERYAITLNSFKRFMQVDSLPFPQMDATLLMGYEAYLKQQGLSPNTSSFYMRNLRAMYNRAVEQGLTSQDHPFRHVYTGIEKTVKRAVSLEVIRNLRNLDLSSHPTMDWARDMFLFSFYTRGMSFIDMAYLKKKDLQNGLLTYRRQKTGQRLYIKWEKPMQAIIDKYQMTGVSYLLPIIRHRGVDERKQYINSIHLINNKLKKIGKQIGLFIPLTTYVARHGWASIARSKNIPISIISEAMGHDSEATTRIYLAALDTSVIDDANSLILESL